ncbi:MAG: polysaccharide deacetylase family protein [Campylobacterales bacterium]|nr:polysaccharide deacetylase family protein [Campylobacterales bacterium]
MKVFLALFISAIYLIGDAKIFVYHRFGDDRYPQTNISIKHLREHFDFLKKHNYEVVPLSKIVEKLKNKEEIPQKWVSLTIDDNFKSFYKNGLPIFKEYNYPFTLFVYVEASQKGYGDYMSFSEIKETSNYGEIALHSYKHPKLTTLTKEQVLNDTKKAFNTFEKLIGEKPKYYAYPFGVYNSSVKEIISSFGFDAIVNLKATPIDKNSNLLDLPRYMIYDNTKMADKLDIDTKSYNHEKVEKTTFKFMSE